MVKGVDRGMKRKKKGHHRKEVCGYEILNSCSDGCSCLVSNFFLWHCHDWTGRVLYLDWKERTLLRVETNSSY